MKPVIALLKNPLNTKDCERHTVEVGTRIIDFLQQEAPDGFGMPIRVFVNQQEVDLLDTDYELQENEICCVLISPAFIVTAIVTAIVAAAINLAISYLFPPKTPAERDAANPVYSIGATNNAARLGGTIPVIYSGPEGVLTTPDFASTPYIFFSQSGDNMQYVDQLMSIGHGDFEPIQLSDIVFGDTPASDMPAGTVQFVQFQKGGAVAPVLDHGGKFGNAQTALWLMRFGGGGATEFTFNEQVYTLPEITDFEFTDDVTNATATTVTTPITWSGGSVNNPGTFTISADIDIRAGRVYTVSGGLNAGNMWTSDVTPDTSTGFVVDGQQFYRQNIVTLSRADNLTPSSSIFSSNSFAPVAGTSNSPVTFNVETSFSTAGPYVCSPIGSGVYSVSVDFVAPNGLYRTKKSDGSYQYLGGGDGKPEIDITLTEIDNTNAVVAGGVVAKSSIEFSGSKPDPVRRSFEVGPNNVVAPNVPADFAGKRYQITIEAKYDLSPDSRSQNKVTIVGVRSRIEQPANTDAYGNTTLLAVRIQATNGISSAARTQIKVRVRRKYKLLNGTVGVSGNPSNIINDIYTDKEHGVGRPASEIDTATLGGLRDLWDMPNVDAPVFNGMFLDKSTAWDGMESALSLAVARPAIETGFLTVVADKKKPLINHVFNDGNIVAGSFSVQFSLDAEGDQDSIEVEYRNPTNFNQAFVTYPELNAVGDKTFNPMKFGYFGLTDKVQAEKLAALLWNRRLFQRVTATFKTDMDGVFPMIGDRMNVSASASRWGVSGRILDILNPTSATPTVVLDKTFDQVIKPGYLLIMITDSEGASSPFTAITQGAEPNHAVMNRSMTGDIDLTGNKEPPRYTIKTPGTEGRNMTVTKISHDGGSVFTIQGVSYDIDGNVHRMFEGTPKHLVLDNAGAPL